MWPICALNVAENGLNCGKKVAKSGQNRAKIGQKTGKKWPILSRMGELLKGTFLAVFGLILSRILSFLDPPGGAPGGPYEPHMACLWGLYRVPYIACYRACYTDPPMGVISCCYEGPFEAHCRESKLVGGAPPVPLDP